VDTLYDASVMPEFPRDPEALAAIIDSAAARTGIPPSAMVRLLDSPTPGLLDRLFAAARRQREMHVGNRVFFYGLLRVSTYCRNRCSFCYCRKTNNRVARYRKTPAEVARFSRQLARCGVHLINLTAGVDPVFFNDDPHGFSPLVEMVRLVREQTGLPVMISFGALSGSMLERMQAAGADWFACYQDTFNRQLFEQLRVGQDFTARYHTKVLAKSKGMLVEEGILCGIGETSRDIMDAFAAMRRLDADQVRAMTFIPQAGTPLRDDNPASFLRELVVIALLRIVFPDLLIPASLEAGGVDGLRRRLDAGANVVDALVPAGEGLAGMICNQRCLETDRPVVGGIAPILNAGGLEPASAGDYRRWLERRKAVGHPGERSRVG
jgi:methylornithine synthase